MNGLLSVGLWPAWCAWTAGCAVAVAGLWLTDALRAAWGGWHGGGGGL